MAKERAKRTFSITRFDFLWIIVIVMLGVNMYWSALVVMPVLDTQKLQLKEQQYNTEQALTAVEQNHQVIENQNNNTALLVELFERQNKLLANQIKLVQELTNATTTLREAKDDLNAQVRLIINQSAQVTAMVQQFRETFSRGLYTNQTIQGSEILGNVTTIGDEIRKLRGEIVGLIELALNRTAPLPTTTNLILPAAMAAEEEDIVGDILASENISRNPPEVNSTEVATGQISGFGEGPVVMTAPP